MTDNAFGVKILSAAAGGPLDGRGPLCTDRTVCTAGRPMAAPLIQSPTIENRREKKKKKEERSKPQLQNIVACQLLWAAIKKQELSSC